MTDLPASTTRELLRARTARLASSIGRALTSGRQRATAVEVLAQQKRLGDDGKIVPLLAARLAQARAAEDEALDEFAGALRSWLAAESPPRATPEA